VGTHGIECGPTEMKWGPTEQSADQQKWSGDPRNRVRTNRNEVGTHGTECGPTETEWGPTKQSADQQK